MFKEDLSDITYFASHSMLTEVIRLAQFLSPALEHETIIQELFASCLRYFTSSIKQVSKV